MHTLHTRISAHYFSTCPYKNLPFNFVLLIVRFDAALLFSSITVKKEKQNGTINHEQHELLMKVGDRDSGGTQCRSDSDNRSHVSGLSSHPSHSSQSQSNSHSVSQSQSQKSHPSVGKTGVVDRLFFPRHELQTMGLLGMCTVLSF